MLAMSSTVLLWSGNWYLEARASSSCMATYVMLRRSSGSDVNISDDRYYVDDQRKSSLILRICA